MMSKTRKVSEVSMSDLVTAGLVKPGKTQISGTYKGQTIRGRIVKDGIKIGDNLYDSLSTAARREQALIEPGKKDVNGWRFFSVNTPDGAVAIGTLRERLVG